MLLVRNLPSMVICKFGFLNTVTRAILSVFLNLIIENAFLFRIGGDV